MILRDSSGLQSIRRDMEHLCVTIGNRLAGSEGERQAAEYVGERFRELGMGNAEVLPFPCTRWLPGISELLVPGSPGRSIACQSLAHSPSTPPEGVEGEIEIFEPVDWEMGLRRPGLEGKIGLFFGNYGESAKNFEEIQASPLKALIYVDTRLQTGWPIANGVGEKFMALMRKPMATISLMDGWDLVRRGVRCVKLICTGRREAGTSWNVVGEFAGSDQKGNVIVLGGHLDSVVVGVGADDDASGVAAVLECARRLDGIRSRHTLRFMGFGAEEQLSVGSTRYVKEQIKDLNRVGFVCNFDGVGAWAGLSRVTTTGSPALDKFVKGYVVDRQRFGAVVSDADPYQDQFPFARFGIPGMWYHRPTNVGASWYHHSEHNDSDVCSERQIALTAESACEMLRVLLLEDRWPFARRISSTLERKVEHYTRELFE